MKKFFYLFFIISILIFTNNNKGYFRDAYPVIRNPQKKITILGTGYVGLVTGACFADFGNRIICADIDKNKIEQLQSLSIPIYEPMLNEIVLRNINSGHLSFTSDIDAAIKASNIIIIAVGTPMNHLTGEPDLDALKKAVCSIARNITEHKIIVVKSTVPLGTCKSIESFLIDQYGVSSEKFSIVSCPEFLREGSAIYDFLNPDRVIIGTNSAQACNEICLLHEPFNEKNIPIVRTSLGAAELIKYVTNSFLAVKISFINEIANLCDAIGVDVKTISYALGLDKRISPQFLNPGPGFGGSCLPKDVNALVLMAKKLKVDLNTLVAALNTNAMQQGITFDKLAHIMGDQLQGKTVAILGLAFKANTDDIRYSPSIKLMEQLLEQDVNIKVFDPAAMKNMSKIFPHIYYGLSINDTIKNADAIAVMTDWHEFKNLDWEYIRKQVHNNPVVIDARNILNAQELKRLGFTYDSIGRAFFNNSI